MLKGKLVVSLFTITVGVCVYLLATPGEALAWGPLTHLVHGSEVLRNLTILTPALQQLLRTHGLAYLYGCVAADVTQAKKYTRGLYTHCHHWRVGWQLLEASAPGAERAFAYGYLSHLAADIYSHNYYVPVQLIVSFPARTLRHAYWEARFDALQPAAARKTIKEVLARAYPECDALMERVLVRTLFSFRTNKRIFNSVMALHQLDQWYLLLRRLGERSRYGLPRADVARYNELCRSAIVDLLKRGKHSRCQRADPTGSEALARALALRRKLRALRRRGTLSEALAAEIRALRGPDLAA